MSKVNPDIPNAYVFARSVAHRYNVSERQALSIFWLTMMPASTMEEWGNGKLTDADIMREADRRELVGTGPWLNRNKKS